MNTFLIIVGSIVSLMFLTWLWAMVRIRTSPDGRLKITKGSAAYYVCAASFVVPALFGVYFTTGREPLKFRLADVIDVTFEYARDTGTKTLCGLFWRTFFLFVIALPGAVLFLPVIIISAFVVLLIFPVVSVAVNGYDNWRMKNIHQTVQMPDALEQSLEHIRYRYMTLVGFFRGFKKVMTAIDKEIGLYEFGPDWKITDDYWSLVGTGSVISALRNKYYKRGDKDFDFVAWLKTKEGKQFRQSMLSHLKTVRVDLANKHLVRNFLMNFKKTACPIVEYETVEN